MPKRISEEYLDSLINAVAEFTNGATAMQVLESIETSLPLRTLQFHLAKLVKQGKIIIKGEGSARRYHSLSKSELTPIENIHAPIVTFDLTLSPVAFSIKKQVTAPLFKRKPVGYSRSFLDEYCPNVTYYLPADTRQKLNDLGSIYEGTLPAGTYIRQVFDRLLIDLSWNSSRLEGNTYSLLETERLFEIGENADGKNAKEAQMILNHKGAIELLSIPSGDIGLDRYTICNIHALLSDNLLSDPQACGRLRSRGVGITGTVFHPLEVPQMIEECFDVIIEKVQAINDPFEQAFFLMVQIPYLQPFEDVNKRVSRLAANIPLVRMNLCPLSFVDVPLHDFTGGVLGVYELNSVEYLRDVFVWAYERSCKRYSAVRQSLGEPDPFRIYHQKLFKSIISDVVRRCMTKKEAVTFIKESIGSISDKAGRKRLIEIVETELSSLHEGSILRYNLRRSDYNAWKIVW